MLRDADGRPLKRNFVHVDDLVSAILAAIDNPRTKRQLFNICMDWPVDYGEVAAYLARRAASLPLIDRASSTRLGWTTARPNSCWNGTRYDMEMLIDLAWQYERSRTDPRIVWYPG